MPFTARGWISVFQSGQCGSEQVNETCAVEPSVDGQTAPTLPSWPLQRRAQRRLHAVCGAVYTSGIME